MADPKPPVVIKMDPEPEEYQEAETQFFYTLGTCVTSWAFVDRQLFRLFDSCIKGTNVIPAAILYYKQKTLQQRTQSVDSLLRYRMEDDQYPEWKRLKDHLVEKLLPTRNILVHHPAVRTGTSRDDKAAYIYAIQIEPYEALLNKPNAGLLGKKQLEIDDLKDHAHVYPLTTSK